MKKFQVVVADPGWKFGDALPNAKSGTLRGASKKYRTEEVGKIAGLLSDYEIADDALLFLWHVEAMPEEALAVVRAWGFEYKTRLIWVKTTRAPSELAMRLADGVEPLEGTLVKLAFGMGHYFRGAHEPCIVARRGRAKFRNHSERSVFFAPVGEHSEKPDAFYKIVERVSGGPYLELFARKRRPGWTQMGDELGSIE